MQRKILAVALTAFCLAFAAHVRADAPAGAPKPDLLIDGVPLPGNVARRAVAPCILSVVILPALAPLDRVPPGVPVDRRFAGTWVGAWGGNLKTILTFESIEADGTATAIYAVGDHALWGIERGWWRFSGRIEGKRLRIKGRITEITYELAPSGRLLATYARRNQRSRAVLTRQSLAALRKPGATVPWIGGKRTFLKTGLTENGKRIRLEAVVFRPAGTGPFPLAVVNHGSTGRGNDPRLFRQTFIAPMLAEFLSAARLAGRLSPTARPGPVRRSVRRGLQRRPGAGPHLRDAAVARRRGPGSRGCRCGHCSAAKEAGCTAGTGAAARPVARRRPVGRLCRPASGKVRGVIDFVGGWIGDGCRNAIAINRTLMNRGARFPRPMLWLYGRNDPFYSLDHSRGNFEAFRAAGGKGRFFGFQVPGGNGHSVILFPKLWAAEVDRYLGETKPR